MEECDAAAAEPPPKSCWRDPPPMVVVADGLADGTSGGGGREKCGKLDAAGRRLVKEDCCGGLSGMELLMVRPGDARGPRYFGDDGACCF